MYSELPTYTVNSLHTPWTPIINCDLTVNYGMYLVYDGIWLYIAVYDCILKIHKKHDTLRNWTQYLLYIRGQTEPGGWCRTSGAGPATPPAPAMTSPARASTCTSRKPRPASRQDFVALMWRRTAALAKNKQRLDSLPVEVQWTHTKLDTAPHPSPAPVAGGLALDMIAMDVTTATNSVGTMDIIAYRATSAVDGWHERRPCAPRWPWCTLAHLHSIMPVCYTGIWVTMQVHNDGDQSLACLDSYTCAISFDSFVCRRSLNLLLKYSPETTRLSAGRPSGAKQCSSRTQSSSLAADSAPNTKIHALLLCTWQKQTNEVIIA
jgi:hypothetical protein